MAEQDSTKIKYSQGKENFFRQIFINPWLYHMVRLVLSAVFIYGGVIKLFHPKTFAMTIAYYNIVPEMFLPAVAIGLPIIETIAGGALLFDRLWGLHVIAGLLAMFVMVLGYGILTDLDVDCGCFGAEELDKRAGLRVAFYRDLVLIGVVVPYLYAYNRIRNKTVATEKEIRGQV
ncbi:MAG: MauE/DoxX family redox-associated membrane protein [Smithella sp.]